MRFVYNVLFALFFVVSLPYYFVRIWRRGNWQRGLGQRFGWYGADLREQLRARRVIWFHAVSVGEANLCVPLVRAFGKSLSGWTIVVSTTTTTGMTELRRKLPEHVHKVYYPIDFLPAVNRALRVIHPEVMVLVEAEIWPNMLWRLADRGTPCCLVNARLSDRSARRYAQFRGLFESIFSQLAGVGVQNEGDADRLKKVGCQPDRVVVTGNLKFDAVDLTSRHSIDPAVILQWAGVPRDAVVLLGSSTHAGEEQVMGQIYCRLRERLKNVYLVVVPRHFERGREVGRQLSELGLQPCLRSEYVEGSLASPAGNCLVVDSTGELRFFYDVADVVFVGKSLRATGGQNPIEPAAAGCAVVMGPHMENFRPIVRSFLGAESMLQVRDDIELQDKLGELLGDPDQRQALGLRARQVVDSNRGAIDRSVAMIKPFLMGGNRAKGGDV